MGAARPKTLIPLPGHEPLMHYIIEGLKSAGISDLLVVTGHGRTEVESFVRESWGDSELTFVFNARYASWGNFHSLRLALDQSPGLNVLAINSDVIVHPDVYLRTAQSPGDLVLAVERRRRLDVEDMRVELRGSSVRSIGKDITMARSHGEFDGVSLLRPRAARLYLSLATDVEWSRDTSIYYEDVFQMMMPTARGGLGRTAESAGGGLGRTAEEIDVRAAFVEPGEYAEVDGPADLAVAAGVVEAHAGAWPRSAAAEESTGVGRA
jgi:choline kinase